MAHILTRKSTGINYMPFEVDNKILGLDTRWTAFIYGEALSIPEYDFLSATQKKKTDSGVPDILTAMANNLCSQRFKDFVEAWEPGLHFFTPVELKRKNGERVGDYYLWSIGQDIDCILTKGYETFWQYGDNGQVEKFNFRSAVHDAAFKTKSPTNYKGTEIRISGQAVAGRHLWMSGVLGHNGRPDVFMFMSNAMYKAFKKEKFQSLDYECEVEEIDKPWIAEENMGPLLERWKAREAKIAVNWPSSPNRRGGV